MAARKKTPIRQSLTSASSLLAKVEDGISAVKNTDRKCLAATIRGAFGDSLDLDAALQEECPLENRWDYLLGHTASQKVIAVEPHSAKQDEIGTVIKKREAAKRQLGTHLKPSAHVTKWLWVASGKVHFANTEMARRRLDQAGIEFVGKTVLARHLL